MSTYSPVWILVTSFFGTGGSPAPTENGVVTAGDFGLAPGGSPLFPGSVPAIATWASRLPSGTDPRAA